MSLRSIMVTREPGSMRMKRDAALGPSATAPMTTTCLDMFWSF